MVPVSLVVLFVCYHFNNMVIVNCEQEQRLAATNNGNTPQSLQSVLYSIEERLRALDLVYVARSYAPRHQAWDTEQYTRRLDSIDARIGRIEALLEMRLDKIQETMSANELKRTLAGDQIHRKIESLYDRLDNRMSYTESHLDIDVAKIQSSIDSGFTRLARTESESLLESDIETQLQDLQRQFDVFDVGQNVTHAKLSELAGRRCVGRSDLNDANEEFDVTESERFTRNMETVATKVNNMVEEFSHRTQTMESLVKNSMSLANATRRELQDGLKTLGLRLNFHGKHNKDSLVEFGSDALATLITKEFANIGARLASSHDKLAATQHDFRQSCHRLQEKEQQLSDTVAKVLDGIIDLIHNRSMDMEKQVSSFQEILKQHNSQVLRTMSQATKGQENKGEIKKTGDHEKVMAEENEKLAQILMGMKLIQEQISEWNVSHHNFACPESKLIAEKILASINDIKTINSQHHSVGTFHTNMQAIDEPVKPTPCDETQQICQITNDKSNQRLNNNVAKVESRTNASILDIMEEEHGDTLHYNVTEGGNASEAAKRHASESIADQSTEGVTDYDLDKTDRSDQYDDEVELEGVGISKKHASGTKIAKVNEQEDVSSGRAREVAVLELGKEELGTPAEMLPNIINSKTIENITEGVLISTKDLLQDHNSTVQEAKGMVESQSERSEDEDNTKAALNQSEQVGFSRFWNRMKNVNGTVSPDAKGSNNEDVIEDGKTGEDTLLSGSNHDFKILDRAQLNHDDNDYNNDYEE